MPSRDALHTIIDGLFAALFPTHFGLPDLTDEGIDYFVGHTLDATLRSLLQQVKRELLFASLAREESKAEQARRAFEITHEFARQLPKLRALLETDIQAAYQGDPAAKSIEEVRFCYPGITGIAHHRIAHELHLLGVPLLARIVAELAHSSTGIDIHPGATIGGSFFIDHGTGVVIGETAVIGERVRLYQAVTLGREAVSGRRRRRPRQGHAAASDCRGRRGYLFRRHDFGPRHDRPRLDHRRQRLDHARRAAGTARSRRRSRGARPTTTAAESETAKVFSRIRCVRT